MSCSYYGCLKDAPLTRGMCSEHYAITAERERYSSSHVLRNQPRAKVISKSDPTEPYVPTATKFGRRAPVGAPLAFIKAHIESDQAECIWWPYARAQNGYPEMNYLGRPARAHRVMCVLAHGMPLLPELEASHTCENGHLGCVNPRHLVWETHYDNHQRRVGRPGAATGERHPRAKITDLQVTQIRNDPRPNIKVARALGLSRSTISEIRSGKKRVAVRPYLAVQIAS